MKMKVLLKSVSTGISVFFEKFVQTIENTYFLTLRFLHISYRKEKKDGKDSNYIRYPCKYNSI